MLKYATHILIALIGLLMQATLFSRISADALKPDLAFLVAVYLGLHKPSGEATPAIVVIGYLSDRFSSLPDGTFLLLYLAAFYVASATSKVFYFRGTGFPAGMVFALSVAYGIALDRMVRFGVKTEEGEVVTYAGHSIGFLLLFAIVNVLFSLPLYRLSRSVDGSDEIRTGKRATLT